MDKSIKEQLEIINQLVKELASVYRGIASKFGISDNEFWVWYALLNLGGDFSQQDICDMWSLPKQTVNSIISNLKKKEYLHLQASPGVKNRKVIRLTEEGRCFGESVVMKIYQAEYSACKKMEEAEREICIALLGKYIMLLKKELYDKEVNK